VRRSRGERVRVFVFTSSTTSRVDDKTWVCLSASAPRFESGSFAFVRV